MALGLNLDILTPSARDGEASVNAFAGAGAHVPAETVQHLCRHDGTYYRQSIGLYVTDVFSLRCVLRARSLVMKNGRKRIFFGVPRIILVSICVTLSCTDGNLRHCLLSRLWSKTPTQETDLVSRGKVYILVSMFGWGRFLLVDPG